MTKAPSQNKQSARTTSFAKHADPAPQQFKSAPKVRTQFIAASARDDHALDRQTLNDRAKAQGSEMVAKDKPQPVLKPGPALAHGVDKASFEARWRAQQRRAAFMARRKTQSKDVERQR